MKAIALHYIGKAHVTRRIDACFDHRLLCTSQIYAIGLNGNRSGINCMNAQYQKKAGKKAGTPPCSLFFSHVGYKVYETDQEASAKPLFYIAISKTSIRFFEGLLLKLSF